MAAYRPHSKLGVTATRRAAARGIPLFPERLRFHPPGGPRRREPIFAMSKTLQPLEPLRQHVQILGGLDDHSAEAKEDGAGDHARANGTFLTGVRLKKSATDIHAGISIDQVLAREVGHLARVFHRWN